MIAVDKLEEEFARAIALSDYPSEDISWPDDFSPQERDDYLLNAQACVVIAREQVEELEAALEATIPVLEGQIESLLGSYTNLIGPDKGKVTDPEGVAWIAEFQEPLDKVRAALRTQAQSIADEGSGAALSGEAR